MFIFEYALARTIAGHRVCLRPERAEITCYFIFGILGGIISIASATVDTVAMQEIYRISYYDLDQNKYINDLENYKTCSSAGF